MNEIEVDMKVYVGRIRKFELIVMVVGVDVEDVGMGVIGRKVVFYWLRKERER